MRFAEKLLSNHPLTNITFVVVLVMGILSYINMPRAQDPEINFNWVSIITALPGASAEDVERELTSPLEDAIKQVKDIKYVSSNSRENVSSILIRFNDLSTREFDKRINDLRREVQNKANQELPRDIEDPQIIEITSSNGFPTAMIAVHAPGGGEKLRRLSYLLKNDIERLPGVDKLIVSGLDDPELHVDIDPARLEARNANATEVADAVAASFRNTLAGRTRIGDREWLVRMEGKLADPERMADMAVNTASGRYALNEVADVSRGSERATQLVSYNGEPAVLFAVTKQPSANTLEMVNTLNKFIEQRNPLLISQGAKIALVDDQTYPTRNAIRIMESNAIFGWLMVMVVCWVFLGTRIAVLVALGIPFSLAATFFVVDGIGSTLNLTVLLGVVIALGMLVDDAVVIVESIYYRLARGEEGLAAVVGGVKEVAMPVLSSVLTTCAAFLPLMLLPGILGKFMFVVPFVVTVALLISLIEAYWILPVHVLSMKIDFTKKSRTQRWRERFTHAVRLKYARMLTWVLRRPVRSLTAAVLMLGMAAMLIGTGMVRQQFFAFDPMRLYYINIDMPPGTPLESTQAEAERIAAVAKQYLQEGEARSVTAASGIKFTETEPLYGDQYGQVIVSLNPRMGDMRDTPAVVAGMRDVIMALQDESTISFLEISGGPPTSKPISVKVRGDDYSELRRAVDALKAVTLKIPGVKDVEDDDVAGRPELTLTLNRSAVQATGVNPAYVARLIRLQGDGEMVASVRDNGEKVDVIVRMAPQQLTSLESVLTQRVPLPGGGTIALAQLVETETKASKGFIRHYKLRRAITLEANLDKEITDTLEANNILKAAWEKLQPQFPNVDLDFSGEMDDLQESLSAMKKLFLLGIGLIYLILAAQFRSYWQPLLILVTVPLAFTGVVLGLFVSVNPLSLYTLYGVIALTGIAVNSAIVLIDAANERLEAGMSVLHATVYAARRRIVPILITTTTTIAGLFSLAVGLGGKSLIWGPVASSIVWGLGFSTILTLFVIPLLYRMSMRRAHSTLHKSAAPVAAD
ncbi:MAG: efflux RND transporter permease subunit [Moraxellaceae bacterium]|nr:efflux RND transporter permease subunit [Moraxellaceae bacterium]